MWKKNSTHETFFRMGNCPFGNEKSMCSAYIERKDENEPCSSCMRAFKDNVPAHASNK